MLASPAQQGEQLLRTWLFSKSVRQEEKELRDKALQSLESVNLLHLKDEYAGNLSGGQKRSLELARTMMASPTMIMFDEPGAGVNPSERRTLASRIRQLVQDQGITVILIGHEMELVMDICDPIVVLERGRLLTEGTPEEVRNDRRVLEVYLGGTMA
jgi:branched-chain amino acid transport system ATP-binding protein